MAVQRRNNILSQERIDCPAFRSIESAASADFDTFIQALVTGAGNPYVINGFAINFSSNPIGGAASNLQVVVANGSLLATTASQSGTFYLVPAGTPNVVLNAVTTSNVSGSFVPSSFNYVGIDYYRFQDPATDQQLAIWDPTANDEDQIIAPAAIILNYEFVISTSIWAANILPIAIVETDSSNNVVSITDSRPLLFRLGTGGVDPNPYYTYPFPQGTSENPVTSTSNGSNPFYGGDKAITDLKDWIDAVETLLLDIGGGPYWYSYGGISPTPSGSIPQLREDATNTILTGNGNISHGVVPDASPILTTTGNTTLGSNQITSLASTVGIVSGQYIDGEAFYAGTTVLSVSGSTVTMSGESTDTVVGTTVSFTNPVATQPGQMNWSNTIYVKVIGSNLEYEIQANPTGSSVTLADGQVAYIQLTRDVPVSTVLTWTGGSPTVVSVGDVTWTTGLLAGDWVGITTAGHAGYYQILTVVNAYTVTLVSNYAGSTTNAPSVYAYGVYTLPGVSGNSRDIQIAARALVPTGPNYFWLFSRNDDGGALPRVYVRWLGMDLSYGVSEDISGPQIQNVLTYIGSPMQSATAPQYVDALDFGSVAQIEDFIIGAGSTITSGQYFLINSSANARQYAVWFKVNGSGTAPVVPYVNSYIEVDILSSYTAAQVAAAVNSALNSTLFGDFSSVVTSNEYVFTVSSANATVGATYTNNGHTFTVLNTISGGTTLYTTGTGAPLLGSSSLLNSAASFAVLGATAVAGSTGSGSTLIGNLGIYPNTGSSITNFPPSTYSGTEYTGPSAGVASTAQSDALAAYTSFQAMTPTGTSGGMINSELGGQSLAAGVYVATSGTAGTFTLNGTLTLTGTSTDVYVFQMASTLVTGGVSTPVINLGSVLAKNVYWAVGSSATLNSSHSGTFQGSVVAHTSITDTLGGTVNGSLIALNAAVTLSATSTITANPASGGVLTKASGTGDATIDFSAFYAPSISVTNTSAGVAIIASNGTMGAPFSIETVQFGTGTGNYFIHDGDNLTLAIKELDQALGNLEASLNSPTYDEVVEIVASGATPPTSLNGPVANGTVITLPLNSREDNVLSQYTVGKGVLQVFLNGQFLDVESGAYAEVGAAGAPSNEIQILTFPGGGLVVGDELEFRFGSGGGGGGGGAPGPAGPPGATGPAGATGFNAAGGPVAISTKTSSYAILTSDCFLMADCTSGNITFTLPTAAGNTGRIFYATKIDSSVNTLTVAGNGSDFINEASMFIMAFQDQEAGFISTGSGWRVM